MYVNQNDNNHIYNLGIAFYWQQKTFNLSCPEGSKVPKIIHLTSFFAFKGVENCARMSSQMEQPPTPSNRSLRICTPQRSLLDFFLQSALVG